MIHLSNACIVHGTASRRNNCPHLWFSSLCGLLNRQQPAGHHPSATSTPGAEPRRRFAIQTSNHPVLLNNNLMIRTLLRPHLLPPPSRLARPMTIAARPAQPLRAEPRITALGAKALDGLLARTVAADQVPALTFGVASKNGVLYEACAGDMVFRDPSKGKIGPDTSASTVPSTLLCRFPSNGP